MPETSSFENKTILIVEDDLFLSNLLATRLERLGVKAIKVGDGEEALTILKQSKPDLMLLDIIIPKKSGFEVLEAMQGDPAIKDVPVIIVSNLGQESDVVRGKNLGAVDYLVKAQVSIDDIISRAKNFLEKGQTVKQV